MLLLALLPTGCGGDNGGSSTGERGRDTTAATEDKARTAPDRSTDQERRAFERTRRSRRDAGTERDVKRYLRQEAAPFATGWRFGDIEGVRARGSDVGIETSLRPSEREAASSLCLAVRRYFEGRGAYGVVVWDRDRNTLVRC